MRAFATLCGELASCAALLLAQCTPAYARPDRVVEVHDGDTFSITGEWAIVSGKRIVHRLPGPVTVRIRGIDTPEIGHLARCQAEQDAAVRARDNLRALLAGGAVTIRVLDRDKYGRLLGEPAVGQRSLAMAQIEGGFAVAYNGSGPRRDWCAPESLLPGGAP